MQRSEVRHVGSTFTDFQLINVCVVVAAVGALGLSSPDVQETLLRCVETAEEAELRLAACRLLRSAGVTSARLRDFLLQRVDVESSQLVRRYVLKLREATLKKPAETAGAERQTCVR